MPGLFLVVRGAIELSVQSLEFILAKFERSFLASIAGHQIPVRFLSVPLKIISLIGGHRLHRKWDTPTTVYWALEMQNDKHYSGTEDMVRSLVKEFGNKDDVWRYLMTGKCHWSCTSLAVVLTLLLQEGVHISHALENGTSVKLQMPIQLCPVIVTKPFQAQISGYPPARFLQRPPASWPEGSCDTNNVRTHVIITAAFAGGGLLGIDLCGAQYQETRRTIPPRADFTTDMPQLPVSVLTLPHASFSGFGIDVFISFTDRLARAEKKTKKKKPEKKEEEKKDSGLYFQLNSDSADFEWNPIDFLGAQGLAVKHLQPDHPYYDQAVPVIGLWTDIAPVFGWDADALLQKFAPHSRWF